MDHYCDNCEGIDPASCAFNPYDHKPHPRTPPTIASVDPREIVALKAEIDTLRACLSGVAKSVSILADAVREVMEIVDERTTV